MKDIRQCYGQGCGKVKAVWKGFKGDSEGKKWKIGMGVTRGGMGEKYWGLVEGDLVRGVREERKKLEGVEGVLKGGVRKGVREVKKGVREVRVW